MDVLVGIVLIVAGLSICFAGIKYWFAFLPLLAFIAGFTTGMRLMWSAFGGNNPFLEYTTGFIVGIAIGVAFAAVCYLYWYLGVVVGAAWTGAVFGAGIVELFSDDLGLLMFIFALAGAILFAALTIILALPVYLVVVNTAVAGAAAAVGGILLMFTDMKHNELGSGTLHAAIEESWFWVIVVVFLAVSGIGAQIRLMAGEVALPEKKFTRAATPASPAAA